MLDGMQLDKVLQPVIQAVDEGSQKIKAIDENVKEQRERLLTEIIDHKSEVLEVVTEADRLQTEEKQAQMHLMQVKNNMDAFNREDIKAAYEDAQHLQVKLQEMRKKERLLQQNLDKMETRLRDINEIAKKTEKIYAQTGLALNLLTGSLQGITYKLEELQLRQQVSMRVIKAQEEERLRVAREIHDGPAQSMANVVLRAEICEKLMNSEPAQVRQELRDLKEMVKESLQEVRKIIFDLRPMVLDDLGVVPTLRRFITELQKRLPISVEFVVLGGEERRLPEVFEVAVFRIVQEALNNIFKHSKAKRAVVRLEVLPRRINIGISDDGCGFETQKIMGMGDVDRDNFGLLGMKERVELLSGEIKINSKPGKGTEIQVNIPVKE